MPTPPLTFDQLVKPAAPSDWVTTLLSNATTLGLTVTSWQSGGVARTILSLMSVVLSFEDATASLIAQGGFLDFAATGTVTFTNADGSTKTVPVTPDPSKPAENPTGALGWLDALADSVYDTQRILASFAGGSEALINTSGATYGPFAAGTYHVSDSFTGATYSNTASLTITPSAIAGTSITSITSSSGLIKITTTTPHGLSTGASVGITGTSGVTPLNGTTAWFIHVVDASNFTLDGSNFAGAFTGGGTVRIPTVAAFQADVIGSASSSKDVTGALNVHTVQQTVTSLSGVSCDNLTIFQGSDVESNIALAARCRLKLQSIALNGPKGAYKFAALSSQKLAPLLNPPQSVSAVITRAEVFADKSTGTNTTWIANAAGAPNSQDVTATDAVIQAYAVGNAVTAITKAASNLNVAAVVNVWVPASFNNTTTQAVFQTAIALFVQSVPIGGLTDPGFAYTNVLPFDDALGALYTAAQTAQIPLQQAQLTLNGGTSDIPLAFSANLAQVAVLSPAAPTVTVHSV